MTVMPKIKVAFIASLFLCISGCASILSVLSPAPSEPSKPKSEAKSYTVKGRTYCPLLSANGYEERGIASWYGPSFHGRRTACGQTFDMYKASAAHKILPLHTRITVTNIENNKTISLVVNDRGPFVPERVLDLSYGAAKQLAMVDKGFARVVIKTSGKVKGQRKNDLVGNFFIHIGAFEKRSDANGLILDMRSLRYKKSMIDVVETETNYETCWHVEYGPFKSMSAANKAHSLIKQDYPSAFVTVKN